MTASSRPCVGRAVDRPSARRATRMWLRSLAWLAVVLASGCSSGDAPEMSPPTAGTANGGGMGAGVALSGQGGVQAAGTGTPIGGTNPTAGTAGVGAAGVGAGTTSLAGTGAGVGGATAAAGGSTAAGTGGAATGGMGAVDCTITPSLTMSSAISTVGIVEFATDLAAIDVAYIEFGLDTSYGMTAPVDLAEPNHRTLLLGMKTSREYHYRIVVAAGSQTCTSEDLTLMTGPLPSQPALFGTTITTPQPSKVGGEFMVGAFFAGALFILDGDGDYVWWFQPTSDLSAARLSWDGKHMWARSANPLGGAAFVHRIGMDGMDVQTWDGGSEFGDSHHDLAPLPNGGVLFIQRHTGQCDTVNEWRPDGEVIEIIDGLQVHGMSTCWINSIHYQPDDDTITWSDRIYNGYVKMTRAGDVLWVLGGANSTFTSGDGLAWTVQHGHHLFEPTRMLMFENGSGLTSMAYELAIDESTQSVNRVWQYNGGFGSPILGDVQRLDNGNTIVNYGLSGVVHEVDPNEQLVRSIAFDASGALGYSEHRASLYGPPPR
jgi:hypothetical protein